METGKSFEGSLSYIRKKLSQEPIEVTKAVICQVQADLEIKATIETKLLYEKTSKELAEAKVKVVTIENKIKS